MKKYKYVYVRGRVDSKENESCTYLNTTQRSAINRFTRSLRKGYEVAKSAPVYMEVVIASNHDFDVTDGDDL